MASSSRTSVLSSTATTVKALFRCTVKGCRFTVRRDVAAERQVCRTTYYWLSDSGWKNDGGSEFVQTVLARGWYQLAAVKCPDHGGRKVVAKQVAGVRNDDVKCNARCTSARRADCECSCSGANHGADWDQ